MKKITIDGEDYILNVDLAKMYGILVEVKYRKMGDHFQLTDGLFAGGIYVLAVFHVDVTKAILVDVKNGGHWASPVVVKNNFQITEEEWSKISGGRHFKEVEVSIQPK